MASVRTYIPGILAVSNYLKKYVNKNSTVLKEYMGDGLYAVVVLAVDILIIVAELVSAGHQPGDQWGDFTSVTTLTATTLDQIQAAIDKFYASIGVTP